MYMAHERRAHILRLLAERGSIRSAALADELGVTDETIRTDLVLLERRGQLRRRHGGAEFVPPPPDAKADNAPRLDYRLVQELLPHIPAGTVLMPDASRLAHTLLTQLAATPLTLVSHAPELLAAFSAAALPHRLLCPAGEWCKVTRHLIPAPATPLPALPTHAVLSPERVELRGSDIAIDYAHEADRRWAQRAIELAQTQGAMLLLAFPISALAPWSGHALPCSPALVATEDNLPPAATPPHARLVPYLDPATLIPESSFDY